MFFKELIKSYPLTFFERLELIELIDSKFLLKLIFFYIFPTFYFRYLILKMPSKENLARILQYVGFEISNSTNELSKTYLIHIKIRKLNLL